MNNEKHDSLKNKNFKKKNIFEYDNLHIVSNINKLEGEHEVYHLTRVSDNANFFANDFVVHNMNKR